MFGRSKALAAPPDPNAPPPLFDKQTTLRAFVTMALSGGALAAVLYAPQFPIPCAIIALMITAFAAQMNIAIVRPSVVVPTIRLVSSERMSALAVPPTPDTTLVTHGAETVVVVDPPAAPLVASAYPTRTSDGRFGHRVVDEPVAPVPPVA